MPFPDGRGDYVRGCLLSSSKWQGLPAGVQALQEYAPCKRRLMTGQRGLDKCNDLVYIFCNYSSLLAKAEMPSRF